MNNNYGYHITSIQKGKNGEVSKIKEEILELKDAELQKSKIMALVELSDLIGAIELYANNYTSQFKKHCEFSFDDIIEKIIDDSNRQDYSKWNNMVGFEGTSEEIETSVDNLQQAFDANDLDKQITQIPIMLILIALYLEKNNTGLNISDLVIMKDITKRAFINGRRG
jgi:hypothetical protein